MESVVQHWLFVPIVVTLVCLAIIPLAAGYMSLIERKVLADIQVRLGPMRVGPHGILQPIADALKLILKEDVIPAGADRAIFWLAPCVSTFTAMTAFAVLPFSSWIYVADVNVGILVIASMSAVGILGIILGGWASNSHYPLLGALRSAAQLVSYEVAVGLALVSALMAAGTLSMQGIVRTQLERGIWLVFDNYGFMVVVFVLFLIASIAETNRLPFDLPEAESELVAGFHTEYSGFRFALYFLAEYANILVMSAVAVTLFWGGWLRPFPNVPFMAVVDYAGPLLIFGGTGLGCLLLVARGTDKNPTNRKLLVVLGLSMLLVAAVFLVPAANARLIGLFWFLLKMSLIVYLLVWIRGTFPRFRYDQLMDIGWKVMIPLGMAAVVVNALLGVSR